MRKVKDYLDKLVYLSSFRSKQLLYPLLIEKYTRFSLDHWSLKHNQLLDDWLFLWITLHY